MNIDFEYRRCPNAQVILNRVLDVFNSSDETELNVTTIEPSLERSIKHRIAHLGYKIDFGGVVSNQLTKSIIAKWGGLEDKEDLDGVSEVLVIKLLKQKVD